MYVKENVRITNSEYQGLFEVSKRTATNDLYELVQKGLFEKTGTRGRGTFYKIKKGNNWANGACLVLHNNCTIEYCLHSNTIKGAKGVTKTP
jgi:hypothetical protein